MSFEEVLAPPAGESCAGFGGGTGRLGWGKGRSGGAPAGAGEGGRGRLVGSATVGGV